jgi:hypothetical protein
MATEMPSFSNAAYSSNTYDSTAMLSGVGVSNAMWPDLTTDAADAAAVATAVNEMKLLRARAAGVAPRRMPAPTVEVVPPIIQQEDKFMRRIVRVFLIDTNESVPNDSAVLHATAEQVTDLTDQELFYEIDVKGLLDKHNAKRVTFRDKSIKSKETMLEPARVRDLKLHVLELARF